VYGANMALQRRVLASNTQANVFHRGFKACDDYRNGEAAISQVTCPILFLLGAVDQMTQAKAAQPLIIKAKSSGKNFKVLTISVGHHQMTEAPEETLMAIHEFLT
jgi:pimeloyl-ACP methyl ester carboxylesterase